MNSALHLNEPKCTAFDDTIGISIRRVADYLTMRLLTIRPRDYAKKSALQLLQSACAPTEIRTPVLALKGPRPGPLDDGG